MPVEIKELIIRTNIVSDQNAAGRDSQSGYLTEQDKKDIIQASVNQVLKTIKRKNER